MKKGRFVRPDFFFYQKQGGTRVPPLDLAQIYPSGETLFPTAGNICIFSYSWAVLPVMSLIGNSSMKYLIYTISPPIFTTSPILAAMWDML